MYCKKCGSPIPDDSRFCNYCGTSVSPVVQQPTVPQSSMANQQVPQSPMANQQVPQNPMANQQVPQNPMANQQAPQNPMANQQVPQSQFFQQANPQPPVPKKKKKKTGLIVLILVLVVLLAAGAVGAMFLLNRDKKDAASNGVENPEEAVTKLYDAAEQCDADLMLSLVPKAYQDELMEKDDLDNNSLKKAVQDGLNDNLDDWKDSYGSNIEIEITLDHANAMPKSDIDDMNNKNDLVTIEAGYKYEVTVTYKGDDDSDTISSIQTALKIDGKWYSLDAMGVLSAMVE